MMFNDEIIVCTRLALVSMPMLTITNKLAAKYYIRLNARNMFWMPSSSVCFHTSDYIKIENIESNQQQDMQSKL